MMQAPAQMVPMGVPGDFNGDGIPDHLQQQQMLMLTVPPGHGGGMVVNVTTPDGQMIPVTLPPGAFPGQQMQIPYTPKQPAQFGNPYGGPSPYGAPPGYPAVQQQFAPGYAPQPQQNVVVVVQQGYG